MNTKAKTLPERHSYFASFFHSLAHTNVWVVLLLFILLSTIILYIQKHFIYTDEVFYNSFINRMPPEKIDRLIERRADNWFGYLMQPVWMITWLVMVSIAINIGTILLEYKVKFRQLFTLVSTSYFIFIFGKIIKTVVMAFTGISTFAESTKFDWSIVQLIGKSNVPAWSIYTLGLINIYQVLFIMLLAGGLGYLLEKTFRKALVLVLATYGAALFLWGVFVMFLFVNLFK